MWTMNVIHEYSNGFPDDTVDPLSNHRSGPTRLDKPRIHISSHLDGCDVITMVPLDSLKWKGASVENARGPT
jgi:hypothetical protein